MMLGKLDSHLKKNQTGLFSQTMHENIFKIDKDLTVNLKPQDFVKET